MMINKVCVAPPGLVSICTLSHRLRGGLSNSAPIRGWSISVLGNPELLK